MASPNVPSLPPANPRAYRRALLLGFALLSIAIILSGMLYLRQEEPHYRDAAREELSAIADLKKQQIVNWRNERLADAQFFRNAKFVARDVQAFLANPESKAAQNEMLGWLTLLKGGDRYERVVLLDEQLTVGMAIPAEISDIGKQARQAASQVLSNKQVVMTDLYLEESTQEARLDLFIPVVSPSSTSQGEYSEPEAKEREKEPSLIGLILLRLDPQQFLFPLIGKWPIPSSSAETYLVRLEGDQVVFLSQLTYNPSKSLQFKLPLSYSKLTRALGESDHSSLYEGIDYRGTRVLASIHAIPGTPWIMVAKVDQAEVYAPLRKQGQKIGAIVFALVMASLAGMFWIWRRRDEEYLNHELAHERERKDLAERLALLTQHANDMILLTNPQGQILEANERALQIYGYSLEEMRQKSLVDLRIPERREEFAQFAREVQNRGSLVFETMHQRKDGTPLPVEVSARQMEINRLPCTLSIIRDITERRQAEQTIRKQAALLDISQDAINVRNLEGGILYWNKGAERIYGWNGSEALGQNAGVLLFGSADSPPLREARQMTLATGEWNGELLPFSKDLRPVVVFSRWTLVRDVKDQPESILVVETNLTEQKKIESQFLRAQRLESLGRLAGGVAHDLNNILAPIYMAVSCLRDKFTEGEDVELLSTIETCAQRGGGVVRQILTFSRGVEGSRGPVEPKQVLRELMHIMRETFPKSIQIESQVCAQPWPVWGDSTQIQQLLTNLCVNARDAMPEGGRLLLRVENQQLAAPVTTALPVVPPGDYVVLMVEDTGEGISLENLDKIFDPFFTTKPIGQGTGLGLATALGIARSHGGGISVESKVKAGTRFTVWLPAKRDAHPSAISQVAPAPPRGHGELILVVDDEPSLRKVLQNGLMRNGYQALVARHGQEAIGLFGQNRETIAAVLTDYSMPVLDGRQTIKVLRQEAPDLPIILMSGLGEDITPARAAELGAKKLLIKPFTTEELLRILAECL